jgi:hypothetical protein
MSSFDAGETFDGGADFDDLVAIMPPSTPPQFGVTTMRMYARFPEIYRVWDAILGQPPNDYPLLRFISLIGDQASEVETLLDRFMYLPTWAGGPQGATSDLVDPNTADPAWLPWLAQIYGAVLSPGMTVTQQRAAIANFQSRWARGSRQSIIDIVQAMLTGTGFVQIVDHFNGDPWQVAIITRDSETPDSSDVVPTVIAAGCEAAGVQLVWVPFNATWADVEATFPTWTDWETAPGNGTNIPEGSWWAVEESMVPVSGALWSSLELNLPDWSSWEDAGSWTAIESTSP